MLLLFEATFALLSVHLLLTDALLTEHLNPDQESRCLNCIRNVSSIMNIDTSKRCEGYFCGPYQLSYTYWSEAGKPGNNQGARDYEKCARDKTCAEQTVRAYFKKYKRDCNSDGIIDCRDMAALHKGGPQSCNSDWFYKSRYWLAFNKTLCMTNPDGDSIEPSKQQSYNLNEQGQQTRQMKNQSLTPECLDCICDAISGCNTSVNNCGSGTVCGPFAISQAYWKDGRRPGASWTACARTKECSSVTMKNYMEKYKRDCNGDGFITCEDYAAIHRRGPQACSNRDLFKDHYWNKFLACRANQKPLKDVNMVKVNESPEDLMSLTKLSSPADPTLLTVLTTTPTTITSTSSTPATTSQSNTPSSSQDASAYHRQQDRGNPTTSTSINYSPTTSAGSTQTSALPTSKSDANNVKFDMGEHPTYELKSMVLDVKDDKSANSASKRNKLPPLNAYGHVPVSNLATNQYETRKSTVVYESSTLRTTRRPDYVFDSADYSTPDPYAHSNDYHSQPTRQSTTYTREQPTASPSRASSSTRWQPTDYSTASTNYQPTSSTPRNVVILAPTTTTTQANVDQSPHLVSTVLSPNSFVVKPQGIPISPIAEHQPINLQPVASEDDYPVPEYPYHSQTSDLDRANFDRVVNNIVTNPDFSKSHPPVPELAPIQAKQEEVNPVRPQQVNRNNFSKTPSLSSKTSGSDSSQDNAATSGISSSVGVRKTNQSPQQSVVGPKTTQLQPDLDNLGPSLSMDNVNVTSLFERGLNESSRIAGECLECICDASSNCDTSVQCISKQREKNRCGLYMISWNQFQESDISLTSLIPSSSGMSEESADERMYYDCTTDRLCAERLIHLYIEKHQKDCNGDGKIDCYDIAAIHRVGPDNCNSGKFLSSQYWKDFNICYATDRLATTATASTTTTTMTSTIATNHVSNSALLMRRLQ